LIFPRVLCTSYDFETKEEQELETATDFWSSKKGKEERFLIWNGFIVFAVLFDFPKLLIRRLLRVICLIHPFDFRHSFDTEIKIHRDEERVPILWI
jgi:hypothetical protein